MGGESNGKKGRKPGEPAQTRQQPSSPQQDWSPVPTTTLPVPLTCPSNVRLLPPSPPTAMFSLGLQVWTQLILVGAVTRRSRTIQVKRGAVSPTG